MKKLLSVLLCAVMVLSLAACGKKENAPTPGPDPNGETEGLTVALVVAGKLGDRSFYDSSKEGLDRMVADLGVTPIVIECNNENHDIQMKNAAEKANIVVCVGWEFYNVETIAPDYPEVNWIWVDNATSAPVSNVLNITYAQNEGSFLAGYIAAAVSETGVVGAVGGEDADTINDFESKTREECRAMGINDSMIHVDFMIGSADLDIDAHTRDGRTVPIFRKGNWAF